jgi:hypothetical protein
MGKTKRHDKFEYYLEDTDCKYCLHYAGKKKGCKLEKCCCSDIKEDAQRNGRIKRERGWNRCRG